MKTKTLEFTQMITQILNDPDILPGSVTNKSLK